MIGEMKAGRIVNGKARERIGDRTIGFNSTAIAYLSEVLGAKPLPHDPGAIRGLGNF